MKTIHLPISFKKFFESVQNVKRAKNDVDVSKEEVILSRLEQKLGKPKEEISNMISKDLMQLLVQVPFGN